MPLRKRGLIRNPPWMIFPNPKSLHPGKFSRRRKPEDHPNLFQGTSSEPNLYLILGFKLLLFRRVPQFFHLTNFFLESLYTLVQSPVDRAFVGGDFRGGFFSGIRQRLLFGNLLYFLDDFFVVIKLATCITQKAII